MKHETRKTITEPVLMTYPFGSRVYKTSEKDSDHDFIIVVKAEGDLTYNVRFTNTDFTVYSESLFIKKIQEHEIDVLECIFQRKSDPYLKYFSLDKGKLRKSISSVSSNSYVKCKKKLQQGDFLIGKKSLFHALRILGFGKQIALTGRIIDYEAYNHYYEKIMSLDSTDWDVYKKIFQSVYNKQKSDFRRLAPKEELKS